MNKISLGVVLFAIFLWPISLVLTNDLITLIPFFLSLVIVCLSIYLIYRNSDTWYFPMVLLPLIDIHFFPLLIFLFTYSVFQRNKKATLFFILPVILIIFLTWKNFQPHSIFIFDYESKQAILRNINLYPNPIYARVFQNKLNIPIAKFENNFLSLIDPNNYFFGSHPHELVDNQNLIKIPFVALIFLMYGLYFLKINDFWLRTTILSLFFVLTLSFMDHFDKFDLVLWPVFTIIIFRGYIALQKKSKLISFLLICSLFAVTLIEYLTLLK